MAGPKKLTKEQVMEMTGMSAAEYDKKTAQAKAPSTNSFDQVQQRRQDNLSPSEGGGCSAKFAQAKEATAPLQAPVGQCPSANANLTLGSALQNSGTENSALNGYWKDREARAGLGPASGPGQ